MDRTSLTFVTVFFETELPLLLLQAKSMASHLDQASVSQVYVVDNCEHPISCTDQQAILTEYGPHASLVRFVSIDELGISRKASGYIRQQLAKLLISNLVEAPWYITLDAKNLFVSGITSGFLEVNGLPTISRYGFAQHPLRKKLELALSYFNINHDGHLDYFTPTVTPFAMYTNITKDLVSQITTKSGNSFNDEFIARGLTEFFLYGAWLIKCNINVDEIYFFVDQLPNVWPKMVNDGGLERALGLARVTNAPIFTVHRKALARIDKVHLEKLAQFWVERQIFSTQADAITFVDEIKDAVEAQFSAQPRKTFLRRAKAKIWSKMNQCIQRIFTLNKINWS